MSPVRLPGGRIAAEHARRFAPVHDGYWDGYADEIDASFPQLAADVARHRRDR